MGTFYFIDPRRNSIYFFVTGILDLLVMHIPGNEGIAEQCVCPYVHPYPAHPLTRLSSCVERCYDHELEHGDIDRLIVWTFWFVLK